MAEIGKLLSGSRGDKINKTSTATAGKALAATHPAAQDCSSWSRGSYGKTNLPYCNNFFCEAEKQIHQQIASFLPRHSTFHFSVFKMSDFGDDDVSVGG